MGSVDWAFLNDGLDTEAVARGVSAGLPKPPGGGDFVYAFHSRAPVPGAVGLLVALEDFAPLPKGGSIRGCLQRAPSGGPTGFSPFLYLSAQGNSVQDRAYLLGLSDEDPHRILLRKGAIKDGVGAADSPGALLASSGTIAQGTWVHLRLDVILNDNGDVVLNVFQNDLAQHPLGTAPNWQPVPGMTSFIDDHLGIQTGSPPFPSGGVGFGFASREVTRRAFVDHLEVQRQL